MEFGCSRAMVSSTRVRVFILNLRVRPQAATSAGGPFHLVGDVFDDPAMTTRRRR